jgi:hypothetical protein
MPDDRGAPARRPTPIAIGRVGRARYGADWVGALTQRERWLLARYLDDVIASGSILSGGITYIGPGGRYPRTNDPGLAAEVERARDRRDWMEAQYDAVFDWLETRGFDPHSDLIDQAEFEKAFAACFKGGEAVGRGADEPSGAGPVGDAASAPQTCDPPNYAAVKAALQKHGRASEAALMEAAEAAVGRHRGLRKLVRAVRDELFGLPTRGAPKKSARPKQTK